jgi:SLOG family YspA-like protein
VKVLICGSRDWDDAVLLFEECSQLVDEYRREILHESYASVLVMHGDSGRADIWADAWAQLSHHDYKRFPAKWRVNGVYNPQAGFERNIQMLDQEPDLVIAFQKNESKGTQHTINEARKRGIPVEVITA